MKKSIVVTMMVLFAFTLTSNAIDLGVFGSYWDGGDADGSLGLGGSAHVESLPLEFRVSVYPDLSIPGAGDALVIPIDFGLAVNLSRAESFDIYIGAGASYYFIDTDRGNPDNQFGMYALARLEIPLQNRMNIFGEAMYRAVDFEDIDANLSGGCFAIGVIFR